MSRRTRTGLAAAVLVAAIALMGAGFPAERVPPAHFADGVCGSVHDWIGTLQTGATAVKSSIPQEHPSVQQVRDAYAHYLGDTADATTTAIEKIKAAGVPSTPKGVKAAAAFVAGFKQIRASLLQFQHQARAIRVHRRKAAQSALVALERKVSTKFSSFDDSFRQLAKLDPDHRLEQAFNASAACQALSASPG